MVEINRYEKARIIGARALQLSLGAPPLVEVSGDALNPVRLAFAEFEKNVIPIAVVH